MSAVVVVGSCNLDLIVEVPALPLPGQTVLGSDVVSRPGGKGANQAVAARRLGADTAFVGAIGNDQFGATLRAALDQQQIGLAQLATADGPSGVALILIDGSAENVVAVAPGANRHLSALHLRSLAASLTPASILLLQLEIPIETCVVAATIAQEAGARVVLNAAPIASRDDPDLEKLLGLTDVLVVNEGEAASLAAGSHQPRTSGPEALAAEIAESGPRIVVITLGPAGAVVAEGSDTFAVPSYAVKAIDSTGAGDAFCGGLAAALAEQLSLREAVRRGCAAGALATTGIGAQAALPTADAVDLLQATETGSA